MPQYFYKKEASKFSFILIPKMLLMDDFFSDLSIQSKLLYGMLLERMSVSKKNGWIDDEGRVFIQYQINEIMENLCVSKQSAIKFLNELEEIGLVEKKKQGSGQPTYLYLKNFSEETDELKIGPEV